MPETQSSYRQVVKATSLFGGVQVFNIVISLIRSKVIAVLLGTTGMGIAGLFNSAVGLIGVITNFGLDTSAVKSISMANLDADKLIVSKEIAVLKRLVWISAALGAVLTIVFSPLLSQLTFGNRDYTMAFVWLAAAVLFKQLSVGQLAVLQGLRKLRFLANANLMGSFFGLLATIPLYYYYGIDGIVPAIIASMLLVFCFGWYFSHKVKTEAVKISGKQAIDEGKAMLRLGFSLSFITLLTTLSAYLLQVFISYAGGLEQVGLFSVGFAIINSYVGLIFNAMGTDYFPRLASVAHQNDNVRAEVSQQAFIAVLIITPIIVLFLLLAPWIIRILYSGAFLPVLDMIKWGIMGMLFKAVSWSMGYILIAKGDSRLFIKTSIFFNSIFLVINIAGYHFYGLEGLGISFLVNHIIHFLVLKNITLRCYRFYFDSGFYKIFSACLLLFLITFLLSYWPEPIVRFVSMAVVFAAASGYSLYEINKKINIRQAYGKLLRKKE